MGHLAASLRALAAAVARQAPRERWAHAWLGLHDLPSSLVSSPAGS